MTVNVCWLKRAVEAQLSSRELRDEIQAARALEVGISLSADASCEELVDHAAASLREQLVECGFPDDMSLTIEVEGPPGIFVTARTGP